jgi:hypothetical protein
MTYVLIFLHFINTDNLKYYQIVQKEAYPKTDGFGEIKI